MIKNEIDRQTIQADRDAAAKALGYKDWEDANDYRLSRIEDVKVIQMVRAFTEHRLASQPVPAPLDMTLRDALFAHLGSEFTSVYDCSRVWEAWSVGTMTSGDFAELNNRLDEIVDGVMSVIVKHAPVGDGGLLKAHFKAAVDALNSFDPVIGQALRTNYAHFSGEQQ